MAAKRINAQESESSRRRAASTPEARENQLINLAVDLAERQLRDGSASAQVISHYLKASSTREYLEKRRLEMDVQLMEAKREQMQSMQRMEEKYDAAITAMRSYQGGSAAPEGHDYDA